MKKSINKYLLNLVIAGFFCSSLLFANAQSGPYGSAYGPQAVMSPAATSSLNLGPGQSSQMPAATQAGNGVYTPGNGVYLAGQSAVVPQANPMPVAPVVQPVAPVAPFSQPSPFGANPYQQAAYAPQQMASTTQYAGTPYQQPGNTYQAFKPSYGQPAHMVQRNSASYMSEKLPYRQNPNIVLNPNSRTGIQRGKEPTPAVMGILNGPRQTTSNSRISNWFNNVFNRKGVSTASNNQQPTPITNNWPLGNRR